MGKSSNLRYVVLLLLALAVVGCAQRAGARSAEPTPVPTSTPAPVATSAPAPSTAAGEQMGRVAFIRDGDIWVKVLPNGDERCLTTDGGNSAPEWSASGRWLAFMRDGRQWVIGADGSDARQLGHGGWFGWSPVEDVLAYADQGRLLLDRIGGETTVLVANVGQFAGLPPVVWSPDGKWLAYSSYEVLESAGQGNPAEVHAAVWRVSADGGEPRVVLDGGTPSADGLLVAGWLPDGSVAVRRQAGFSGSMLADGAPVSAVDPNGGERALLPATLAYPDFLDVSPANGTVAVVGAGRESWTRKQIATVDPASGAVVNLTDASVAAITPVWSPDGRRIAYVAAPDIGAVGGGDDAREGMAKRRIWVMDRDGSDKRQLTVAEAFRDERPRWSADGAYLLFGRLNGDEMQLWLMAADGTGQRQVVAGLGSAPDPAREAPAWFGYYGHADWDGQFDWWQGTEVGGS